MKDGYWNSLANIEVRSILRYSWVGKSPLKLIFKKFPLESYHQYPSVLISKYKDYINSSVEEGWAVNNYTFFKKFPLEPCYQHTD